VPILGELRDQAALPPDLTCDDPDGYPWGVIHDRHPRLVATARAAHPYGPTQHAALARLAEEMERPFAALAPEAPDSGDWRAWAAAYQGRQWDELPFLWAESYFYRRLLGATGYFAPGPWYRLDPFAHLKAAELADPAVDDELAALDRLPGLDQTERDAAVLHGALWGNQADLGFRATHGGELGRTDQLVVDDSAALWDRLRGEVVLVADNAGRELLADLVLVDHVLHAGRAERVTLHVKPSPYFVSDATTADLADCLRRLARAGGYAGQVAARLHAAFAAGRAAVRTHWFYAAPFGYDRMPADLAAEFTAATVTVLKGDLNYRRLVGDRHWPATTGTAEATGYFPGPVAALRTCKSDVIVGLDHATVRELDAQRPDWRVAGSYAMVQVSR
jgi:hypothetical protein